MKHYKTFNEANKERRAGQMLMYDKDKGFYLEDSSDIEILKELERVRQSDLLKRMRESGLW